MDSLHGNNTEISALDVFSAEKIIEMLKEKGDCTQDLVEIIKTTPNQNLKKLSGIFLQVDNFEIEKIIELTVSKTRVHRFNSTFLVFSLIKANCLMTKNLDMIEILFQSVFTSRFRDVDPAIRAMCLQFLCEWMGVSKALRSKEYLKYLGWALNDKSDSVRRKAIRSILRISKFCKKTEKNPEDAVIAFVQKHSGRLVEMALMDTNVNIQKDSCKCVISIFLKNNTVFSEEVVLNVMSNDEECYDAKHLILKKLCPDGIWDLPNLHRILKISKPQIFRNLRLSPEDINSFVMNTTEFIKNTSVCCDSGHICFLDILCTLPFDHDPLSFIELLDAIKDNNENIVLVVTALRMVKSYAQFPGSTFKILDYLRRLVQTNDCFVSEFVLLLKMLEEDYSLQVEAVISDLKEKYILPVIKSFDVSDLVDDRSPAVVKCYAALWKIMKEDYAWISSVEFDTEQNIENTDNAEAVPLEGYLEILDFIVFFHSKMPSDFYSITSPVDPQSSSKILFDKLVSFVTKHFHFKTEEACIHLFKLISIGQFTHTCKLLFEHCSEGVLKIFINRSKGIKPLALGYLEYLEHADKKKFVDLSKMIAMKINRNENDRYFFGPIKRLTARTDLVDSVLINFLPCLNVTECIVLENLAPKSKFKAQLLRKCKSSKNDQENITFI